MPLTLPTHPVAVVPLKLWRPRWFDGVALVLGAVAPDIAYAADGYGVTIHSHAWHAAVWWAVPVTLLGARLVRRVVPTIAAHLPAGGTLALRDYGVLGTVRHPWPVTALSAVLGALSHIVWDAFTHPVVDGGKVLFGALRRPAMSGVPWWLALSRASDVVGFAGSALLLVHIGRTRVLRRWYGPPPPRPTKPVLFWSTVTTCLAAGLALLPVQPVRVLHDQAIRLMLVAGLALVAGAIAVAAKSRSRVATEL